MLPVESFFVSFISLGEGWHNYHHAFPWDYKAAEWGTGYNSTRMFIEMFQKIGWAYDLREASQNVINARAKRLGDGTHVPNGRPEEDVQPIHQEIIEKDSNLSRCRPARVVSTG